MVEGGVQNLMKAIDEFQTDNKVQFVRETITKDFGSAAFTDCCANGESWRRAS